MAYESDFESFRNCFIVAGGCCVLLPYATPIVGIMGLMISDPAMMVKAADQWHDISKPFVDEANTLLGGKPVQKEFHPPMATSIMELRGDIMNMVANVGMDKVWVGESYQAFAAKAKVLDEALQKVDQQTRGTGSALKVSAEVYHAALLFIEAITYVLMALATYVGISSAFPPVAAQAHMNAAQICLRMGQALGKMFGSHTKAMWKVTALVALASTIVGQFSEHLPSMMAVTPKPPSLIEAKAVWDPAELTIGDDPMPKVPAPDTSVLPEIGF
ncbi:hypothetical protein ACIBEJ_16250 [Nonomuraea sp. NPDC050790]|uniref:hypothetical protein n=1 Tax=Nonomuraea sp. NPDC050790 TaxID=3364371 RepID=UPI00378FA130